MLKPPTRHPSWSRSVAPLFDCSDPRFWRPLKHFRGIRFDGTNYPLKLGVKEPVMAVLDGLAIAGREIRRESAAPLRRPSRGGIDWDDVRVFLAVAREGSMRAAGRALGLSQPTIARRLAAFEATFGGPTLFDRLPEGLRLNAAGERLVP